MEIDVNARLKTLNEIKEFVDDAEGQIEQMLTYLNWDVDTVKNQNRVQCPIDNSHLIKAANVDSHVKKCGIKDVDPFPDCNNQNSNTVVISKELTGAIIANAARNDPTFKIGSTLSDRPIPQSFNQMITDYTTDERRALYDYVVGQNPVKRNEMNAFCIDSDNRNESEQKLNSWEELAMIRDMKRRSVKYKVSTNAKSYTEVMREVLDNLMASYGQSCSKRKYNPDYPGTDRYKRRK